MAVLFASMSFHLVCLVIILGVSSPVTAIKESSVQIPPGYVRYESVDAAYKVHPERRTWIEAKQACLDEGAHLAIIDSMEKVRYVAGMKGPNVYVWTGISRPDQFSPWVSSGSHSLMPHFPWAPGKPYGSHNCIAVRGCNRGLTNESCSSRLGFVCQMSLSDDFGTVTIY